MNCAHFLISQSFLEVGNNWFLPNNGRSVSSAKCSSPEVGQNGSTMGWLEHYYWKQHSKFRLPKVHSNRKQTCLAEVLFYRLLEPLPKFYSIYDCRNNMVCEKWKIFWLDYYSIFSDCSRFWSLQNMPWFCLISFCSSCRASQKYRPTCLFSDTGAQKIPPPWKKPTGWLL